MELTNAATVETSPAPIGCGAPAFVPQPGPFGTHYEIVRSIGKGGMGEVFAARCLRTNAPVALKVLAGELVSQPDWVERFRHEGRCVARVSHSNVVSLVDAGTDPTTGVPYLVFEHLKGDTLATHMARYGRMSPERAISTLLPVLDALEAAHHAGVVHRDLKPANVILVPCADGTVRPTLIDFGLALADGEHFDDPTAVEHGAPVGTPLYMAPEQARGTETVDARADVWAAGILLFEMIAGRTPVVGRDVLAVLSAIATKPAPRIDAFVPDVPRSLCRVLDRALAFDPKHRFATIADFRHALRTHAEGTRIKRPSRSETPTTRVPAMNNADVHVPATAVWATPPASTANASRALRRGSLFAGGAADQRMALLCALLALVVAFAAGIHEAVAAPANTRERPTEPPPCAARDLRSLPDASPNASGFDGGAMRGARARCVPSRNAVNPAPRASR